MNQSIHTPGYVNKIGTFQCNDAVKGRTSVRHKPNQTIIKHLHKKATL